PSPTLLPENETSGCRSASKKSGAWRWAFRFSSLTSTLATRALPVSSPSSRVASKLVSSPVKVATPRYLTAKPTLEWTGSAFQVPTGLTACCCSRVELMRFLPPQRLMGQSSYPTSLRAQVFPGLLTGLTLALACALAFLRNRQRALRGDRVARLEVERVQEAQ